MVVERASNISEIGFEFRPLYSVFGRLCVYTFRKSGRKGSLLVPPNKVQAPGYSYRAKKLMSHRVVVTLVVNQFGNILYYDNTI